MRIVVISDVHGNLPALEYVFKKEAHADMLISLGDVVNYGPWSNECVDLLESFKNKKLLSGNHEEAFITGKYPGSNIIAQKFFEHTFPEFKRKDAISKYEKSILFYHNKFVHTVGDSYVYIDSEVEIDQNTFIGHSHQIFEKVINGFRLVNVGSVGQNRRNLDEINYAIWDASSDKIELIKQFFSADKLIQEMQIKNYPIECINYLLRKRTK